MSVLGLATKYRPHTFEDVVEQSSTTRILKRQIELKEYSHTYLFAGPSGCGKTTIARIMANMINEGQGSPEEIDSASNNSVEAMRALVRDAQMLSLSSNYKIYIFDECHMLSKSAWDAGLKLFEEPPAKTIFMFCTTDPQKIPATILSRVQRFDFQRISFDNIVKRLQYIIAQEVAEGQSISATEEALQFIAKIADGGMRSAITLLEKCFGYENNLTLDIVVKVLGTVNYDVLFDLTNAVLDYNSKGVVDIINSLHMAGVDIKMFMKQYADFVLDLCKYSILKATGEVNYNLIQVPSLYKDKLDYTTAGNEEFMTSYLNRLIDINNQIKWEQNPKRVVEMNLLLLSVKS